MFISEWQELWDEKYILKNSTQNRFTKDSQKWKSKKIKKKKWYDQILFLLTSCQFGHRFCWRELLVMRSASGERLSLVASSPRGFCQYSQRFHSIHLFVCRKIITPPYITSISWCNEINPFTKGTIGSP